MTAAALLVVFHAGGQAVGAGKFLDVLFGLVEVVWELSDWTSEDRVSLTPRSVRNSESLERHGPSDTDVAKLRALQRRPLPPALAGPTPRRDVWDHRGHLKHPSGRESFRPFLINGRATWGYVYAFQRVDAGGVSTNFAYIWLSARGEVRVHRHQDRYVAWERSYDDVGWTIAQDAWLHLGKAVVILEAPGASGKKPAHIIYEALRAKPLSDEALLDLSERPPQELSPADGAPVTAAQRELTWVDGALVLREPEGRRLLSIRRDEDGRVRLVLEGRRQPRLVAHPAPTDGGIPGLDLGLTANWIFPEIDGESSLTARGKSAVLVWRRGNDADEYALHRVPGRAGVYVSRARMTGKLLHVELPGQGGQQGVVRQEGELTRLEYALLLLAATLHAGAFDEAAPTAQSAT